MCVFLDVRRKTAALKDVRHRTKDRYAVGLKTYDLIFDNFIYMLNGLIRFLKLTLVGEINIKPLINKSILQLCNYKGVIKF